MCQFDDIPITPAATRCCRRVACSPHTGVMLSSSAQASGSVTDIDLHEYARARSETKVKLAFADGRVS